MDRFMFTQFKLIKLKRRNSKTKTTKLFKISAKIKFNKLNIVEISLFM